MGSMAMQPTSGLPAGPSGPDPNPTPGGNPSAPIAPSPAPPKPSPGMQSSTQDILTVQRTLTSLAKQYPEAAPAVRKMNDLLREVLAAVMKNQPMGEVAAPPVG